MVKAGASIADITPKGPEYLGGYGLGPLRMCKDVSSRLYVRCLAIYDERASRGVVFMSLDTQGLLYTTDRDDFGFRALERALAERLGDTWVLFGASSHSHCSPDTTGLWGGVSDSYASALMETAIEAAVKAASNLEDVELFATCVATEGLLRSQVRTPPHDRVDGRAWILEARSTTRSEPVGRLIVYSAHATVASGNHISSDWPGAVAASLDRSYGGTTVVLPGTIGRTQPRHRGRGSQADVEAYAGRVLEQLEPSIRALSEAEPLRPGKHDSLLFTARLDVQLGVHNPGMALAARLLGAAPDDRAPGNRKSAPPPGRTKVTETPVAPSSARTGMAPARLSAVDHPASGAPAILEARAPLCIVRLGELTFVGMPGEAYPNLGWELERSRTARPGSVVQPVVCSMVLGQVGYLVYPPSSYPALALRSAWNDNAVLCPSPGAGARMLDACWRALTDSERPRKERLEVWEATGLLASTAAAIIAVGGLISYAALSGASSAARFVRRRIGSQR